MARKRGTTTGKLVGIALENAERSVLDAAPDEAPTTETEEELRDAEDDGQRPPEVRISRADPDTGRPAFLAVAPVGRVSPDWLKKKYGGGEYTAVTYGTIKDEKGTRFGYIPGTRKTYRIDPSIPFKGADDPRVYDPPLPVMERKSHMSDIMEAGVLGLLNSMQSASKAQSEAFTLLLERAAERRAPIEWDKLLVAGASVITAFQGMFGGGAQKADPLEMATKIAEILNKRDSPAAGFGSIEEMLDVAERLNRRMNGDDEPTLLGVVKESLPHALTLLERMAGGRGPAAAETRPALPAAAAVGAAETVPVMATATDEWTPLEPAMAELAALAQAGKKARYAVAMAMMALNEEQLATLRERIVQDNILDLVIQRFPVFAPRRVWLAEFLDELRFELFPDDGDDGDGAGDGDDDKGAAS